VSVHAVPSGAAGFEHAPEVGSHVPATWHWSLAAQATGFAPVHAPPRHVSVCVHALPSLQVVPFAAVGFEQVPVLGLQAPATWHWSLAVQVTGFAPAQMPAWQESTCVHALPSLQLVPLGAAGFEHAPLVGSQTPAAWHWSLATQTVGFDPVQAPLWQESVPVHALPSLHDVPSLAAGFEQVPDVGSHVPATWH
jgi:hypothetical protein